MAEPVILINAFEVPGGFVNIARWQTAEDFQRATQSAGFRESAAGLASYRPHPGLYRIVRT